MIKPIEVTSTDPSTAKPPATQGKFMLRDFSFEIRIGSRPGGPATKSPTPVPSRTSWWW